MQKWSKKKTDFPLVLLFILLAASTVIFIERSIQRFNPEPQRHRNEISIFARSRSFANRTAKQLDRYSKCRATLEYSGRRSVSSRVKTGLKSEKGRRGVQECDLFSGKWVYDNGSYPLYDEAKCPYMSCWELTLGNYAISLRPDL